MWRCILGTAQTKVWKAVSPNVIKSLLLFCPGVLGGRDCQAAPGLVPHEGAAKEQPNCDVPSHKSTQSPRRLQACSVPSSLPCRPSLLAGLAGAGLLWFLHQLWRPLGCSRAHERYPVTSVLGCALLTRTPQLEHLSLLTQAQKVTG